MSRNVDECKPLVSGADTPMPPFRVTFPAPPAADLATDKKRAATGDGASGAAAGPLQVESYVPPDPGPYPEVGRCRLTL